MINLPLLCGICCFLLLTPSYPYGPEFVFSTVIKLIYSQVAHTPKIDMSVRLFIFLQEAGLN